MLCYEKKCQRCCAIYHIIVILMMCFLIIIGKTSIAQDPFLLSPSGNTQEFFKYVTKDYNISGTIYHTGMLNLSGYKRITSGTTGEIGRASCRERV